MSLRLSQLKDVSPDSHDLTGGRGELDAACRAIDITRQLVCSGRTHSLGPCLIADASQHLQEGANWHPQAGPDGGNELSYSLPCSTGFIDPVNFPIFLRLIHFCEIIPSFRLSFATENSS